MKSNKGFTLIELLAVIVILAIIALIATPIILGVIGTAKEGSAKSSALGYIDAVEKQAMIGQVTTDTTDDIALPLTTNTFAVTTMNDLVTIKGSKPTAGTIVVKNDGSVTTGTCLTVSIQGTTYHVTYDGSNADITDTACTNPA